jgi:hypothetical protein
MLENLPSEKTTNPPTSPLAIISGGTGTGAPRIVFVTKLLRRYQHGDFMESVGYKSRNLPEAQAYVMGLSDKVHGECASARIYECENPRMVEATKIAASLGGSDRPIPGLRLVEEFPL